MLPEGRSERVLIVAPVGRDGVLVAAMLTGSGIEATSVGSLAEVMPLLGGAQLGVVLLTEEALHDGDEAEALLAVLAQQPPWSDVPILLLSGAATASRDARLACTALEASANVTLIERPVRGRTLARAAHAALRARRRQYDMREMLTRERETRREVEAASRAKDEFLATVSHELRTPLNAILGWARLTRDGGLPESKRAHAIDTIERNAVAQAQLIEDLLDVSRIVSGTLRLSVAPVDLGRVIAAARDVVQPAADAKGITLVTNVDPIAALVDGDTARLQQVAWNLIANAVKFSTRGGRVEIRVEAHPGGDTLLSVTDEGEGIDPAFLPHVFERFRQADGSSTRAHGGLGLGLAIVRSIVELHGGTVEAKSGGLRRGSKFVVRLPHASVGVAARDPVDFPALRSLDGSGGPLRGVRVLVVDDEPDAREMVTAVLEHVDAEVVAVASVREALARLPTIRPELLVADIGMPGQDGYSLIRAIRSLPSEEGGEVLAVALTAYARPTDRSKALAAGFDEHVVKPVDIGTLLSVLERLAKQRRAA